MPLNEIAQTKLIEWLNGLHKSAEEELLEKFGERGRNLIAMAQIFTEDEEWARELMSSGILINYLGFILRNFEDLSQERKKEITEKVEQYIPQATESVEKNDWLNFHKVIGNMLLDLYQLAR